MAQNLRNIGADGEDEHVFQLYASIQKDGDFLRDFDRKEFYDTPLHVAAIAGHIDVAMEIINLKPSLGKKLNQEGLSPLHLAVRNGHEQLVSCLIKHDKDLVRLKGKKGETALHIATKNGRSEALGVLCQMLRKSEYCEDVVDLKDRNGDTALHIAARSGQHEMLRLLLKCNPNKLATTQTNSTALEIAEENGDAQSVPILRGRFWSRAFTQNKFHKRIVEKFSKTSELIFHGMDNLSTENRNALLVILSLLLTTTYQASITPPGGVVQIDISAASNSKFPLHTLKAPGKSVMNDVDFLEFYIPTCIVFLVTFFLTLCLLKPFPRRFRIALQVLLAFLAVSFNEAILFIAPSP